MALATYDRARAAAQEADWITAISKCQLTHLYHLIAFVTIIESAHQ